MAQYTTIKDLSLTEAKERLGAIRQTPSCDPAHTDEIEQLVQRIRNLQLEELTLADVKRPAIGAPLQHIHRPGPWTFLGITRSGLVIARKPTWGTGKFRPAAFGFRDWPFVEDVT